ncbi:ferric siderophore receptor [Oxalicibacterium flavum]|uniref:Ferric siderophore receptor n=1 Tax=Oxalicibacterium flavum TaxID=179467 RepID=A0A8J2XUV3_9BURK|nr:TonB-dependent receptor [Oxalicibacterium flavum]GGC02472.1 ferric siderophore receptor [Oxalicibacterium flavum]
MNRLVSLTRRPLVLAVALAVSSIAQAQNATPATVTPGAVAATHFRIAAGPLGDTLVEIARRSHTAISVDPALVQGLRAPAIEGELTVEQAVQRALAGHSLELVRTQNGTLTVVRRNDGDAARETGALPAVKVSAVQAGALDAPVNAGALGSRSMLETPFSGIVVSNAELQDRQVAKLGDVFATDASVSDNSGAYGAWTSYLTVRGLALDWQNSYRIDGKPFLSYVITLPYEHLEQVDLLKGSSGFMYGFGSPGGMVNYVTKKPTEQNLRSVDIGYSTKGLISEHVDLGGRLGEGGRFGYRLNASHEEGKTFNNGSLKRNSLSLALDARLTDRLTWDFQSLVQDRDAKGQEPTIYTGLMGNRLPSVVRNNDRTLVGGGTFADNAFRFYSTGLQYALAPDWKLSASYSHSATRTRRNESVLYLSDSLGNYDDYHSDYAEAYQFNQVQAMLEGKFATGSVQHQVVFGASSQVQKNDYSSNGFFGLVGTGNLREQNVNRYDGPGSLDLYRAGRITQKALFASDTIAFSEQLSLLAGLRYTDYRQVSYGVDGTPGQPYEKDGVLTPTVALMFRFDPRTMAYASYIESLEPGSSVGVAYRNNGELLDPLKSRQYEVGIKTERTDWSATAALFRIEKKAEYANADNYLVQDGQSVYQGLELGSTVQLGHGVQVGGSLMLLDSEYRQGFAFNGNRVAGAPETIVAAQLAWEVPQVPGLRLHANAKYTGPTMLRPANDVEVSGYTLFNLGASYDTRIKGYETTFRLALNNVTDKRYWMFQYSDYVKTGDPRSLSINASLKF